MAVKLQNIDEFLSYQTDDSLPTSADTETPELSSYSSETVVIDAVNRNYEPEIKFMNPDNLFIGEFWAVSSTNRFNLVEEVRKYLVISAELEKVKKDYVLADSDLRQSLINRTDNKLSILSADITYAYQTYVDTNIATALSGEKDTIQQISANLRDHVEESDIHVKKDKTLQRGLNAQFLNGFTSEDIINAAVQQSMAGVLTTIDCGLI